MPNRIIKESIRESYEIDQLSPHAEILFYRLITFADDFGLFKSDPKILNNSLFPLKGYRENQVILWIDELVNAGLIKLYVGSDLKPYGFFITWLKHQSVRNQKSKYPQPEIPFEPFFGSAHNQMKAIECMSLQLKSIEFNCIQMQSNECNCSFNPIQSESISESISESESNPSFVHSGKKGSDDFELFYQKYPLKKGKVQAQKTWTKLLKAKKLPKPEILLEAIDKQIREKEVLYQSGKFCPEWKHPSTWLNSGCWTDEVCLTVSESEKRLPSGRYRTLEDRNKQAAWEFLNDGEE